MNPFTAKQKTTSGVAFVLDKLNISTPYGRDLLINLAPFKRGEDEALRQELDNVALAADAVRRGDSRLDGIESLLARFKDVRGSLRRLGSGRHTLSEVELFELKSFLLTMTALHTLFIDFSGDTSLAGIDLAPPAEALDILDPEGTRLHGFYVNDLYSDHLREIREAKKALEKRINAAADDETYEALANERLAWAVKEDEEEQRVRAALTSRLAPYGRDIERAAEHLGRLDFTLAKARLSAALGGTNPRITENAILLQNVRNPEVDAALMNRGTQMTPVSIELNPGACVLTGANMGGKSVALKTIVQSAYLFQCGFPVFAETAALPLFDHIDFILDDNQSIHAGLSSFGAEIVEINGILARARQGFSLIILDEPARGTNPHEGRLIAAALAERLNTLASIALISTHFDNVAPADCACYTVAGLKKNLMAENKKITPERIQEFIDYRLVRVSGDHAAPMDALRICQMLGLDPEVLRLIPESIYTRCDNTVK